MARRRDDDEPDLRLRPVKPRTPRDDGRAWAKGFKLLMHYARTSRRARQGWGSSRGARRGQVRESRAYQQRCAVRAIYSKNATRGQWRAHGRYVARESATLETGAEAAGFNGSGQGIDIAHELDRWQSARDPLVWKLILSPEFGDRMDLERLTREVMKRMEQDLGTRLEWVAVSHHNTEHPHVHVALRGLRDDGQALRLERSYVKEGIRAIAAEACTRQLGYRTELDAAEAERREVFEKRYTSLDRAILNTATAEGSPYLNVVADPNRADLRGNAKLREQHIAARLVVLENMGLAEAAGPNAWHLKRDAEAVLRAMQRVNDHQKILAAQGPRRSLITRRPAISCRGSTRRSNAESATTPNTSRRWIANTSWFTI